MLCISLIVLFAEVLAKRGKRENSGSKGTVDRFEEVASLVQTKGIIHTLTDRNFTRFVVDKPRKYHAALFLTAMDERYACQPCGAALQSFKAMAKQYAAQYDFTYTAPENRIAFFIIDVDSAKNTFNDLGLETVPRLFIMPPKMTVDAPAQKATNFEVNTGTMLGSMSSFLAEVNRVTGIELQATIDPFPVLFVLSLLAVVAAMLVHNSEGDISKLYSSLLSPSLWIVFSLVAFTFGVSGSVYCIIRNTPLYNIQRGGQFSLFSPQSRDQTVLEGITVALFTLGISFSMYLVQVAASTTSLDMSRLNIGIVGWWLERLVRAVLAALALAVLLISFDALWESYIFKTQWYRIEETMPSWIWSSFMGKVTKSSGFVKRFVKLVTIYIYDFKSWPAFSKSIDTYLLRFLYRTFGLS